MGIAGFSSVSRIIGQFFGGMLSSAGKKILANVVAENPDFAEFDVHETLKTTQSKVLYIISEDDPTVSCKVHFDPIENTIKRDNVKFLKVNGKRHNPNYTEDAVVYKDAFFADYVKAMKKKKLVTDEQKREFKQKYDWDRMTAQDMELWQVIFDFIES